MTKMAFYNPKRIRIFGRQHHGKDFGQLELARLVFEHETGIDMDWEMVPEVWEDEHRNEWGGDSAI